MTISETNNHDKPGQLFKRKKLNHYKFGQSWQTWPNMKNWKSWQTWHYC